MLSGKRKFLCDMGFIAVGLCIVVMLGTYIAISAVIHGIMAALDLD